VFELAIIYIGDREVGKTHLAMELANPKNQYVKVNYPEYEILKSRLYVEHERRTRATIDDRAIYDEYLEVKVQLPTGSKQIPLDWIDTPGEIWRKQWQVNKPSEWQKFLETIRKSDGIILIVPPYREMIENKSDSEYFATQIQWCNRFERWLDFFRYDCPKIRHLILCLNKADLFCDLEQEAYNLAYSPHRSTLNWQQRHDYVFQKFFRPVHSQIKQLNQNISGLSVRCFITSIYNRNLLELPWIYLASFLAK
jgi:GTPase SAR1 family protein